MTAGRVEHQETFTMMLIIRSIAAVLLFAASPLCAAILGRVLLGEDVSEGEILAARP